jgi:surface protein
MEHIKINDDSIRIAVKDWLEDPLKAEAIYGHISGWDTSEVTDMRWIFKGAKNFNQPLGNWDVSNVTNMYEMFTGCEAFNQPIGDWDVSKVTNMFHIYLIIYL